MTKAFGGAASEDEVTISAKYICKRLKSKKSDVLSQRDIIRLCQKSGLKKAEDFEEPLEMLKEMHYIKELASDSVTYSTGRRPSPNFRVNPLLYENPSDKTDKTDRTDKNL